MKSEIKTTVKKRRTKAMTLLLWLLLVLSGCAAPESKLTLTRETPEDSGAEADAEPSEAELTIVVYVCGAVHNPGIYELAKGSRVFQAVALAGGFTETASAVSVNQAQKLEDAQQVRIPTVAEAASLSESETGMAAAPQQININQADSEKLTELTGIGPSRAMDIIRYREQNGPFKSIEEIKNVNGIGDKTYEKIKADITID